MIEAPSDEQFMRQAFREAEAAFQADEVPVGALVVAQGRVIARAHNLTQRLNDVTAHAEMQVITAAADHIGGKYLHECTLYVTLEPCVMCAGAMRWAQLGRLVFGAFDAKFGAAGSLYDFSRDPRLNHRIRVMSGVEADPCRELMQAFFRDLRARKRSKRSG